MQSWVLLLGEGELRLKIERRMLISQPESTGISLDCPDGPSVIAGALKGTGEAERGQSCAMWVGSDLLLLASRREGGTTSQGAEVASGS